MSLFAHRFVASAGLPPAPLPGRFDDARSMRVDDSGKPIVETALLDLDLTSTKGGPDPSTEARMSGFAQLSTRGGPDPQSSGVAIVARAITLPKDGR
jgi:hypothetical protein